MLWIGFRGGGGLRPSLPVRWLALAAIVLDRLPGDDQHRRLGGDRRRLRGHDRRRPDHPRRADLRRGRVPRRQPLRRHLRPGELLRLRPVRARHAVERRLGRARRRRTPPRSPSTSRRSPGSFCLRRCACVGGRRGPRARGRCWRSPGSPTRTPTSRCSRTPTTRWSRRCSSGRWSLFARPLARGALLGRGDDGQVRAARAGAAVRGRRPRPAARPGRAASGRRLAARCARCSSFVAAFVVVAAAAARPAGDRSRASRPSSTAPWSASSTAPRRSASGARSTGSSGSRTAMLAATGAARRAARLRPAAAHLRPGRRARRRGADRAPALGRPLVLPLHPVVLRRAGDRAARLPDF